MPRRYLLACVLAGLIGSGVQADDLADLLLRVPGDMNTVAVINVREINKTPRAVKEKWRDNHETEYLAGAMAVPPWTTVVVVGADLHPGGVGDKSIALIPVDYSVNSSAIARRENGVVQTFDDLTLVLSPRRGYYGFPSGGIVAVSSTIPRQDFARWVRAARKPEKPAISEYLQQAVAAHKDAHVLIATDLKDLFDPTSVRSVLQASGAVTGEAEVNSLTTILTGARGIVFTAQVGERTAAVVRVEFSVPMADFLPAFRRLWPKALERVGLVVDEFRTAEATADGKAVVVSADLSDTSLRRVLSMLAAPGDAVEAKDSSTVRTPKESAQLAASLRYYKGVNNALDDLKAGTGAKGKDYVRSATLFDNYAARIEKLPQTDVDPALVSYGASVATKMRAMAGSLRGAKMQLEAFDNYKSTTYAVSPGLWRWGGGSVAMSTNVQELDTKSAELVAKMEPERAKIWGVLESDRSAVRKEMLDKYKIDFDEYKR